MTPPGKCDRILRYGGIAKWLRQRTLTPSPLVQIQLPLPKSSRGAPRVPLLLFDRGSKDGAVACTQASWFTFTARKSASSLARRRARESSPRRIPNYPKSSEKAVAPRGCHCCFLIGVAKTEQSLARKRAGSHSPPVGLRARSQDAGRVNLRRRRIPNYPKLSEKFVIHGGSIVSYQRQKAINFCKICYCIEENRVIYCCQVCPDNIP